MNYDYALYGRGFVFLDKQIQSPKPDWKNFTFNFKEQNYYIYYDKKNDLCFQQNENQWCLMLGMAMDTIDWHMELDLICRNCLNKYKESKLDLYNYLDNLNGRFVLIFGNNFEIIALNDATATRSVYYHESQNIIASHYKIIANITKENHHPYWTEYQKITNQKPWTLPGDLTPYNNIKILTANHEWNLTQKQLKRFYPRENHKQYSTKDILTILPTHLKNQMNTLSKYHTPIISITAGNDSKVTMAASHDIRSKAIYFTFANEKTDFNNLDLLHRYQDSQYAQYITSLYGLTYKQLTLKPPLDPDIMQICKENHYHQHIPTAIVEYIDKLPKGIHIQSNLIEIIRDLTYVYPKPPKNNTPQEIMAGWMMYWNNRHELKDIIGDYWNRNQWDKIYNFERVRLFYWEHRMSCWNSAATLLENDWAFDTYLLLNCRKLLEFGFSIPKYARDKNLITKIIVKELWPELLFRIENSNKTLYDSFEIDNCGKLNLNNLVQKTQEKDLLLLNREYSSMFGFDKTHANKGESCEIFLQDKQLNNKHIQISLSSSPNSLLEEGVAEFYIKINDEQVISNDFKNVIDSTYITNIDASETQNVKLTIGIKCLKDINLEEYGQYLMLNIDSIRCKDTPFLPCKNIKIETD